MNTRAIAIGLFSLFFGQLAMASQTKCEIELISRERFLFRELFKRPEPIIEMQNVQNSDVYGVSVDGRGVLDVAKGGGIHPNLLSLRWSGRLSARKAHDFLSKVFPAPSTPSLVFSYQDDHETEFVTAGVPKMGTLYYRILKHNVQNWRQAFSRQEGEFRVRVDGVDGPLRNLSLSGDLNNVGRADDQAETELERAEKTARLEAATDPRVKAQLEAELNSESSKPAPQTPALVMVQFEKSLLDHPDFRQAVTDLVEDTADDASLFNYPSDVVEVIHQSLPN